MKRILMNMIRIQRHLGKCYPFLALLSLLWWPSEGMILAASYPTLKVNETESQYPINPSSSSYAYKTPSLDSSVSKTLVTSSLDLQTSSLSSSKHLDVSESSEHSVDLSAAAFNSYPSLNFSEGDDSNSTSYLTELNVTDLLPSSIFLTSTSDGHVQGSSSSFSGDLSPLFHDIQNFNIISHFHTPLMSLLVAPSSHSPTTATTSTTEYSNAAQPLTTISSEDEISVSNHLPVPTESYNKKLLMLVLRAEDCTKFSKSDFEKMLAKLMTKFGFNDAIPEVSSAKCYSHLNINVTVGGPTPTLRFLPDVDGKNNFTVDVLNRTFRIIKFEKVDLRLERTKSHNSSSTVIAAVADHESIAYIAVGVCFGVILVICVTICCVKCCCLRNSRKRYSMPKGTHVRLKPEDYTLTPLPRPNSLYVDYYRGSATGDIFSTTSAGSIASTTPTVEQGVVQPFDTSIVPLEDSSNLPVSRDPSVESVPVQSDLKTFNIHRLSGKGLRNVSADSKEKLHPTKSRSKKVEIKPSGVTNPTFQRY